MSDKRDKPGHPELPFIAYTGNAPYIFISYAHDDAEAVYAELQWLNTMGFNIWYDEGISPGHGWQSELAHSIENSALFLLYVSERSLGSPNCRRETNFALEKEVPVLAIHLDASELNSEWQFAIGDRQAILKDRFSQDTYEQKLLGALRSILPQQTATSEPEAVSASISGTSDMQAETHRIEVPPAPDALQRADVVSPSEVDEPAAKKRSVMPVAMFLLAAMVASVIGYQWYQNQQAEEWLVQDILPAINELVEQDQYGAAFRLAKQVETRLGREYISDEVWQTITASVNIHLQPEGTTVSYRSYDQPEKEFLSLGKTPLDDIELPRGMLLVKLEKEGFDPATRAMQSPSAELQDDESKRLLASGPVQYEGLDYLSSKESTPDGMIYVPTSNLPLFFRLPGTELFSPRYIPAYHIDRLEITNRQFKDFVDAGAYRDESFWEGLEFVKGGESLSWQEAREQFVDSTGEPGPASWAYGSYPDGKADYPVNGVSWYEAMAYARFARKTLPTAIHWARAAISLLEIINPIQPHIVAQSNFSSDLVPVGQLKGFSSSGALDMAGNVREWVTTGRGQQRLILGGGIEDPPYLFSQSVQHDAWDRNLRNGFRCMRSIGEVPAELFAELPEPRPTDMSLYRPVSEEVFTSAMTAFKFPAFKPEPEVNDVEPGGSYWDIQKVSIRGGVDGERFDIYIYLPKIPSKTYQGVVYMPGSDAFAPAKFVRDNSYVETVFRKHLNRGRAVIWPMYYGSYHRYDNMDEIAAADRPNAQLERLRRWHREVYSTLNYLESRGDFEIDNFSLEALSFGAIFGVPLINLEPRFKAAVLLSGTISASPLPAVSTFQHVLRTTTPTLLLNGQHDYLIPVTGAQAMFDNLATDPQDKRFVTYDTGHWPMPRNQSVREINSWLDKYLGPVQR
jgi:formylglycine-generating enzyme required for sulfatase activity/dienelactone hydrolase